MLEAFNQSIMVVCVKSSTEIEQNQNRDVIIVNSEEQITVHFE